MKIREIMSANPITIGEHAPLSDAAQLMWEHDIGFLPVLANDGALTGVITDRDAFIAAYFQGKPLAAVPIRTAMSRSVASVAADAEADEAELLMSEHQVHRLPVLEGGKLVGVVSLNDLARHAGAEADQLLEEEVALTLGAISQPRMLEAP